ncbi:RNA-directed DNA polymerase, eukaryota [Tanacetum coccineum]
MGDYQRRPVKSNEDYAQKISHSIYVTNFPDSVSSHGLWRECIAYGTVVDVFIPLKKSQAVPRHPNGFAGSFVNAVNRGQSSANSRSLISPSPALVLDENCIIERDYSKFAMGRVKDVNSIPNLLTLLYDEGFMDVKLKYLGGLWVMFEFDKVETKANLLVHTGVNYWFQVIQDVLPDFVSEERIVWVDIEGVPLHAWSYETFSRIGRKWGELLNIEDSSMPSFGRKRVCILTKSPISILESFKIIVRGKIFMVRAKELFIWNPNFLAIKEELCTSDDDSVQGEKSYVKQSFLSEEEEGEFNVSEVEGVAETIFDDTSSLPKLNSGNSGQKHSEDPFELYDLLSKKKNVVEACVSSPSLSHPPGFTLVGFKSENNKVQGKGDINGDSDKVFLPLVDDKVLNTSQVVQEETLSGSTGHSVGTNGGSVLGVLEEVIRVGQAMGYSMEGCEKDVEAIIGLGNKTKKEWIKELTIKNKLNLIAIQETKMDKISHMDVKFMWGNSNYDFVCSDSLGNSGGILCIWEASVFKKDYVSISDNFVAIYGTWLPSNVKFLFVVIYAPQQPALKRVLWEYISLLLSRWNGEAILMGDFNEVRSSDERRGSWFNQASARVFNHFISSSGLIDIKLEGFSFTWSHPSATKMSKLDRFLVTDGVVSLFPSITALCLDRHLSDHRPILLRDIPTDFGPIPFRFFHSWFKYEGFDEMVEQTWRSFSHSDRNGMVRFKKKLQDLKAIIRQWIKDKRIQMNDSKQVIKDGLCEIDKKLDQGLVSDSLLARRRDLNRQLDAIKSKEDADSFQKSKIRWAIEGDENSKFFHGIINKKRSQLAIRGVFVDGVWQTDPCAVKVAFRNHFEARFKKPTSSGLKINFTFPKRLVQDQADDLERSVTRDEIRMAVWNCGDNKSPGPDGYSFEFFKKYWSFVGPDLCEAVEQFFMNGAFSKGCNSSFIALIPKVMDAKLVSDFRPISLIGCVYKVVTKIMANRLATVISDIISDTQSAFVSERQILDGPFIINEVLHWCKRKNKQAMFFKVDFAKAYDSVRWDFLIDVLEAFGFGSKWCHWIRGTFCFAKASVLVNGSPSNEFLFHGGLKQGDPLAPYLFILVMESLHLSFSRVVDAGMFKGIRLSNSLSLSHLFYADDALIIGEWSNDNLRSIINVLKCFHLASGLQINIHKSQLLGVENMSRHKAWADDVLKLRSRLSKWKSKTLSIGGSERLGVSSFYALNRAMLLKWVWRFVSEDGSLWSRVIQAVYGSHIGSHLVHMASTWSSIMREVQLLKSKGFDFMSLCSKRVGDENKQMTVANKMAAHVSASFRRPVRGGIEQQQLSDLVTCMDSVSLSVSHDRWVCSISGDGSFSVKDIRNSLDDLFLPSWPEPTRWVKSIPIKINVFTWRARRDCLPTRSNLIRRGISLDSDNCPICCSTGEDASHVFFQCELAQAVMRYICRWWDLEWQQWSSFSEWNQCPPRHEVNEWAVGEFLSLMWLRRDIKFKEYKLECKYVVPTGKDNFIVSAGRPNMVRAGRTIVRPGSIILGPS